MPEIHDISISKCVINGNMHQISYQRIKRVDALICHAKNANKDLSSG